MELSHKLQKEGSFPRTSFLKSPESLNEIEATWKKPRPSEILFQETTIEATEEEKEIVQLAMDIGIDYETEKGKYLTFLQTVGFPFYFLKLSQ